MKVWENAIKDFSYYLRIERGLSENTAVSYSSDLEKLAAFAAADGRKPWELTFEELEVFVQGCSEKGLNAKSQARIVSAGRGCDKTTRRYCWKFPNQTGYCLKCLPLTKSTAL